MRVAHVQRDGSFTGCEPRLPPPVCLAVTAEDREFVPLMGWLQRFFSSP